MEPNEFVEWPTFEEIMMRYDHLPTDVIQRAKELGRLFAAIYTVPLDREVLQLWSAKLYDEMTVAWVEAEKVRAAQAEAAAQAAKEAEAAAQAEAKACTSREITATARRLGHWIDHWEESIFADLKKPHLIASEAKQLAQLEQHELEDLVIQGSANAFIALLTKTSLLDVQDFLFPHLEDQLHCVPFILATCQNSRMITELLIRLNKIMECTFLLGVRNPLELAYTRPE